MKMEVTMAMESSKLGDYNGSSSAQNVSYYYQDEYYSDYEYGIFLNNDLLVFELKRYEVYINGMVWSALMILTVFANCFVCGFFLQQEQRRKSTSVLFISIAVSDLLTGLVHLPVAIYVYAAANDLLSPSWCKMAFVLRFLLSRIFHTVSTWQTVLLTIQIYLVVCYPLACKRWTTVRKTLVTILIFYALSVALHSYHFGQFYRSYNRCQWLIETPCKETCIYIWLMALVSRVIPFFVLAFFTTRTVLGLQRANTQELRCHSRSQMRRKHRRITLVVIAVVILMMVTELPHGAYDFYVMIQLHAQDIVNNSTNHKEMSVYEILMVLSFLGNFWIYFFLLKQFRLAFLNLITCTSGRHRVNQSSTGPPFLSTYRRVRKFSFGFVLRRSAIATPSTEMVMVSSPGADRGGNPRTTTRPVSSASSAVSTV